MSVLLCVKMDIGVHDNNFDEIIEKAFDMEGAYRMLQLPTLQWKIWGVDPNKKEGCGFYLFKSREAAEAYAEKAILTLQARPGVTNLTSQIWTIAEAQTHITKGPIDLPMISELEG